MTQDRDDRKLSQGEFAEIVENFEDNMDMNSDLYVVFRKNPYYRIGTYLYLYNEGFQKVEMVQSGRADGSAQVGGSRGPLWRIKPINDAILIPRNTLLPFVKKMPRRVT